MALVDFMTEPDKAQSWERRKEAVVAKLAGATRTEAALVIADKGYNMRDMLRAAATSQASDIDVEWSDGDTVAVRLTRTSQAEAPSVGVSVADAQAQEALGAMLNFRVTLDAAQGAAVSVRYATADGTATAGADYVSARGAVRFAPGQTSRTIAVAVLDDAHDDSGETLTLTLSEAFGAQIADGSAIGTITNADAVPKAWLARFGRTVASHVVDAIGERFTDSPETGSHVTIAGRRVTLGEPRRRARAQARAPPAHRTRCASARVPERGAGVGARHPNRARGIVWNWCCDVFERARAQAQGEDARGLAIKCTRAALGDEIERIRRDPGYRWLRETLPQGSCLQVVKQAPPWRNAEGYG